MVSTQGQEKTGNVGAYTIINAYHCVFSKDVGEHAKISSEKFDVYVGNIFHKSEITAFSNIHFMSIHGDATLTAKNGQIMEQVSSSVNAFKSYVKPNAGNTFTIPLQASSNISVNVKNADLSTLSIEMPFNFDFCNLSESKATLFAVETKPGQNTFKIESDKNKVTCKI